jgi:hypothetical protein
MIHRPLDQEFGKFRSMGFLEKKKTSAAASKFLGVSAIEPVSKHELRYVEVLALPLARICPQSLSFKSLLLDWNLQGTGLWGPKHISNLGLVLVLQNHSNSWRMVVSLHQCKLF